MLPVTRANLDHICCICLMDIRPSAFSQKVYEVKKENGISKILKLTAHITILKNPINQKYVKDYCRKICEICFEKAQYSYCFREKIMASTVTLKELLDSSELNEQDIERLKFFCRICLNRQKTARDIKDLYTTHLNWLKNCSGIRYTTLIDTESFRIKEGTNINEIALINDKYFPNQLCANCIKKLQSVEEFRKSATQTFEYMISVMGDTSGPEELLMTQDMKQFNESLIWRKMSQEESLLVNVNCAEPNCKILEMDKCEQEQSSCITNVEMHNSFYDMEAMINTSDVKPLEDKNVLEFMDDIPYYSDSTEDFSPNLFNNKFSDCNDNAKKTICLSKTEAEKSKQDDEDVDSNLNSKKENIATGNAYKRKLRLKRVIKQLGELHNPESDEKLNENETLHVHNMENGEVDNTKGRYDCEYCLKIFPTRCKYRLHRRAVHECDLTRTINECMICSKIFKHKRHLTNHIKTVHEKLRPFQCSFCKKTFSANSYKRVHELTHTGDYPFECKWCGRGFRQSSQLKIHSEIHTSKPELLCPICKRSQKSEIDLENHLKSHNDNRFQCPNCGKFFRRSHHMRDHHNAVHLKLRPFKCEFCELTFGDRKTRKSHQKCHTEERPITCSVCKSGFKTNFSLSRHMNQFGHKSDDSESEIKKKKSSNQLMGLNNTENLYNALEPKDKIH